MSQLPPGFPEFKRGEPVSLEEMARIAEISLAARRADGLGGPALSSAGTYEAYSLPGFRFGTWFRLTDWQPNPPRYSIQEVWWSGSEYIDRDNGIVGVFNARCLGDDLQPVDLAGDPPIKSGRVVWGWLSDGPDNGGDSGTDALWLLAPTPHRWHTLARLTDFRPLDRAYSWQEVYRTSGGVVDLPGGLSGTFTAFEMDDTLTDLVADPTTGAVVDLWLSKPDDEEPIYVFRWQPESFWGHITGTTAPDITSRYAWVEYDLATGVVPGGRSGTVGASDHPEDDVNPAKEVNGSPNVLVGKIVRMTFTPGSTLALSWYSFEAWWLHFTLGDGVVFFEGRGEGFNLALDRTTGVGLSAGYVIIGLPASGTQQGMVSLSPQTMGDGYKVFQDEVLIQGDLYVVPGLSSPGGGLAGFQVRHGTSAIVYVGYTFQVVGTSTFEADVQMDGNLHVTSTLTIGTAGAISMRETLIDAPSVAANFVLVDVSEGYLINTHPGAFATVSGLVFEGGLYISGALDLSGIVIDLTGGGGGGGLDLTGLLGLDNGGTGSDLSGTGPGVVLQGSGGAALTVGAVPLDNTAYVSGVLGGANGGLGLSLATVPSGYFLMANGTGTVASKAPGVTGTFGG